VIELIDVASDSLELNWEMESYEAPQLISGDGREEAQAEWPVVLAAIGILVAILGIAAAIILTICSICGARSLNACVWDVRHWWGAGC
jgi:hypothetical protein